jgi:hypothetical protein
MNNQINDDLQETISRVTEVISLLSRNEIDSDMVNVALENAINKTQDLLNIMDEKNDSSPLLVPKSHEHEECVKERKEECVKERKEEGIKERKEECIKEEGRRHECVKEKEKNEKIRKEEECLLFKEEEEQEERNVEIEGVRAFLVYNLLSKLNTKLNNFWTKNEMIKVSNLIFKINNILNAKEVLKYAIEYPVRRRLINK